MTSPGPATEMPETDITTTGLEESLVIAFSIAKFKKAINARLQAITDGDDTQQWVVFSSFDPSKLKSIDRLHYPIRLHIENNKLIVKVVTKVHEMMHRGLFSHIQLDMNSMGLRPSFDYTQPGAGQHEHRSGNSWKEADSTLAPLGPDSWPSLVVEAGWSESLAHLRIVAQWWLSAQLPPNSTTIVVLISFKRSQRTFRLERYEIANAAGPITRAAPLGARNVGMCTTFTTIDLRQTPPATTGAPFVLPFTKVMGRPPAGTERDISLSAATLQRWALSIAERWRL